jgi:hypothetical protein
LVYSSKSISNSSSKIKSSKPSPPATTGFSGNLPGAFGKASPIFSFSST